MIEALAEQHASILSTDVRTLILHYAQMLRRYLVSESEIAELCHRIYAKQRRPLGLIYAHPAGLQAVVMDLVRELGAQKPEFILDELGRTATSQLRFVLPSWDLHDLLAGEGWTMAGRVLLFEVTCCNLALYVSSRPQEARQRLFARHGTVAPQPVPAQPRGGGEVESHLQPAAAGASPEGGMTKRGGRRCGRSWPAGPPS